MRIDINDSRINYIKPKVNYRKESFGGIGFDPDTEDYYYLTKDALELFRFLSKNNITLKELSRFKNLYKTAKNFILNGVLFETANIRDAGVERPSPNNIPHLLSFPTYIDFYPTFRCNERCTFCYIGDQLDQVGNYSTMNIQQIEKFVQQLDSGGLFMMTVLGGEPFLYQNISTLIDIIAKTPIAVSLSTNGTVHDVKLLSHLYSTGIKLNISFHDSREDVCSQITRHRKSKALVERFIKLCEEIKYPYHISVVVCKENLEYVVEHVKYLINEIGVKVLSVLQPQKSGYAIQNFQNVPFNLYRDIYEKCLEIGAKNGVEINASSYYNFLLPDYERMFREGTILEDLLYGCGAGTNKVEILPNGDVFPCSYMFSHPEFKVCNIFDTALKDAWTSSSVLDIYRKRTLIGECEDCPFAYVCKGGIICENILHHGQALISPPNCPLFSDAN